MPPTLTPLGSRIAGAVLGALLDPEVFRSTQRAASSLDGFVSEHSQYNLIGLEYLASRSSWEASSPMNLESYIPYWKIRTLAAGGVGGDAADADRRVLAQLNATEMSYEVVGVHSKAVMLRHAAAYGVFHDEETLLQAVSAMMFMYRNDSLEALSSAYFIARVAFRLVHSEKTTPRRLLEEVPKAQWLQWKLKEVKEKVKEAMDVKSQLFQQDSVDDHALRSMGRVWQKADRLRPRLDRLRPRTWASEVLPNSLYFILKYEHDLMAALEANAKVHGAGSRAVVIGLVLGAFHGHHAFVDLNGAERVLRLLRQLPLLRDTPGREDVRLLPPNDCFDTLYTAFSCCGPHEPPGMTCWMSDLKKNCCHGTAMTLRTSLLRRLEQMKEEKRCGSPEDYLYSNFMMQGCPEDIAASWASDGSTAEPADPGAVEAARRWCGLEALQEDDDMILPLYDAMAKMVMTGRLVNLGAGTGSDPLWWLVDFRNVTRAVFIDPRGPPPGRQIPSAVRFLNESAEPQNLKALLRKGQLLPQQPRFPLPVEVDFLKVDVDGCDCVLASEVLHFIRPKVIIMEINWSIPPPLRFVRHCHEDWYSSYKTLGSIGFVVSTHGCSLLGISSTLEPFGFALWRLQGHGLNAVFLRRDVQEALGHRRADETACFNEAWKYPSLARYVHFSLVDDWRRGSGRDALKHAWSNFSCYHSLLGISHMPFSLWV